MIVVRALEPADFPRLWPLLYDMRHGGQPQVDARLPPSDALRRMSTLCGMDDHCIVVAVDFPY